jgi:DNA helicase II / ATP-dependent DNA helicase PcrA
MDKRVIFAVAGAGKTTKIISGLNREKRFLIITYTENNFDTLRRKIIEKFGFFPENIFLYSYFTFLHAFCFKPFMLLKMQTKGINFEQPPDWTRLKARSDNRRYIDGGGRLYHNRLANLVSTRGVLVNVIERLEKYFDFLCIDEIQDFGGHDFNLVIELTKGNIDSLFVGDFFQHTFDTSKDGTTNKNLHVDLEKYKTRFKKAGLVIDTTSLSKSHRCSKSVCEFIYSHMGIEIYSHNEQESEVKLIECPVHAERLHGRSDTVKLFYKEHMKYGCYSQNWGGSKGQDQYNDVCVVLTNSAYLALKRGRLAAINPQTKNKLYVACSRARGNLYFVNESAMRKFKVTN